MNVKVGDKVVVIGDQDFAGKYCEVIQIKANNSRWIRGDRAFVVAFNSEYRVIGLEHIATDRPTEEGAHDE